MPVNRTGNKTHDETCTLAESARQSATRAAGASAATVRAADIAFYRSCLTSAQANGAQQGAFVTALWSLGIRDV